MRQIIKNRHIVNDDWEVLHLSEEDTPDSVQVPDGKIVVPLQVWLHQKINLGMRSQIGIWLSSHEQAKDIGAEPNRFALIAIDFPKFADGRGYSIAYNLRTRLGYTGELRAMGDVLRDQLFYMQRVGFNSFAVRADKNIHDAIKGLTDFTEKYQGSVDETTPLFGRAQRESLSQ